MCNYAYENGTFVLDVRLTALQTTGVDLNGWFNLSLELGSNLRLGWIALKSIFLSTGLPKGQSDV